MYKEHQCLEEKYLERVRRLFGGDIAVLFENTVTFRDQSDLYAKSNEPPKDLHNFVNSDLEENVERFLKREEAISTVFVKDSKDFCGGALLFNPHHINKYTMEEVVSFFYMSSEDMGHCVARKDYPLHFLYGNEFARAWLDKVIEYKKEWELWLKEEMEARKADKVVEVAEVEEEKEAHTKEEEKKKRVNFPKELETALQCTETMQDVLVSMRELRSGKKLRII